MMQDTWRIHKITDAQRQYIAKLYKRLGWTLKGQLVTKFDGMKHIAAAKYAIKRRISTAG